MQKSHSTADHRAHCPVRVVCRCLRVTEAVLVEALRGGQIRDLRELRCRTGAGDGCMVCHELLRTYLEQGNHFLPEPICSVK